jgi:autotransporter-associated beta strand protein
MTRAIRSANRFSALLLLAAGMWAASPAQAAFTYTWTRATPAGIYDWTATGNWDTNGVPVGATDATVQFFSDTATALADGIIAINTDPSALTLNALTLNGKGAGATADTAVNIGTAGNTWTFDGTNPAINLNGLNGVHKLAYTIAPNITLYQNMTVTGDGSAACTFSGNITDSSLNLSITKNGASTLTLSGTNGYTGTTAVNAGILRAGSATAFGQATAASLLFGAGSTGTVQLNGNFTATR